jgi:hypothetical protein
MTTIRTLLILALLGLAGITAAQQEDDAGAQPDEAEQADAGERPTTVIDELSQAEIDAELARAEEILDDPGDVEEFTDTKPLPADLPLALPSDF